VVSRLVECVSPEKAFLQQSRANRKTPDFAAPSAGINRLRFKGSSELISQIETLSPLGLPCIGNIFRSPTNLVNREKKISNFFLKNHCNCGEQWVIVGSSGD
jgi:hypothetical protein